ncbi:MAG: TonB-dependent receptor [Bryobacterales bacterium]|nr:TonB-dependent receptor [Bryobacterales bacterium]
MLAFLCALTVQAQPSASVVGNVKDITGAAIINASVRIQNVRTGLTQQAQSGAEGAYSLLFLPVGEYSLDIEAPGFQRFVRQGIVLAVNDRLTIDVTLQLGATSESITVSEVTPLLEAQTGALRGVVDQQRIVNLPLNGRNMTQLISLQAGAIQTQDATANGEGIGFAVNGSRQNGMYYLLDGGYNTSTYRNYSGTFPNPDAVQEFSVQRSNFSAEYANATGGVVNVITKSGTNEFHGSAFAFVRNAQFNARNFFAPRRDTLKRNQFGGTLGGPVIKDKLFFFGAFQGQTLRSDPQLTRQFVPTQAYRAGDFSGINRVIRDPVTGQPFPGNQIPTTRFNPVTLAFLEYIPVGPAPTGERFTGAPNVTDSREYTAKLDWNLSKQRITGKIFRTELTGPMIANPNDVAQPIVRNQSQPYWHISGNHLYTFSPTVLNNANYAWRYRARFTNWGDFRYPINFQTAGVKDIAVTDPPGHVFNVNGYFNASATWPYEIEDGDHHFSDTLTWIRGKHEIKVGGEYIHSTNVIRNYFRTMGIFTFSGQISGDSMADFFLGEAASFLQGGGEYKDMSGYRYGLFVQDDWRVLPTLTLNVGLRWDPTIPYTDGLGRMQCIRLGQQSTRFPNAPPGYLSGGDAGCPQGGFDSYHKSFAPRLGFAWRTPLAKTVVRGGYGLFWNPQFTAIYQGFINGAPFSPQINRFGVKFDDPYGGTENPFPASFAPFDPPTNSRFTLPIAQVGSFDPTFRPSYMQMVNLTVEREFAGKFLGRASYVGNYGRRLSYSNDINYGRYVPGASTVGNLQSRRPLGNFGNILEATAGANSHYQALQTSVERRFSNLSFELNYTYSKVIDDYSADPTPGQSASLSIPFNRALNRGLADFDVRHRAVLSTVWFLPKLENQNPFLRQIVGSWEVSGIVTGQSGRPFSTLSGIDNSFSGINRDYPDLVGDPYLSASRSRAEQIAQYFNPAAYTANALGTFGTSPRNHIHGPGLLSIDMALMKSFPINERLRTQFRAEFFNVPNLANFNNPFATRNNLARFGRLESAGDPRIIQLALKLLF